MRPQLNSGTLGGREQRLWARICEPPSSRYPESVANALPPPPPGFDDLSPEDQVRYVGSLWDRIVADQDRLPVSDAQRALLRERLAAHRANPSAARPWSEVRREVEAALAKPGKP